MSRARRARLIVGAAAVGGGGLGLITGGLYALLVTEAKLARRTIDTGVHVIPPRPDGVYGAEGGDPIRMVMIGDSSAAGLGVQEPAQTPGAQMAAGLSAAARRAVTVFTTAKTGATSADLAEQVSAAVDQRPDLAVIMIGANDVTNRIRPSRSVAMLGDAVRRLRAAGAEVVVGTCPDLGTIEPIRQPLRFLARRWSRQLAAAQTIVVVEAGGRTVSLGALLGPEFAARPLELFGPDRFHPSAAGYATASAAVLPSLCAALGVPVPAVEPGELVPAGALDAVETLRAERGEGVLPVALAAAEAANSSGAEVTPLAFGSDNTRARRAQLRHRMRRGNHPDARPTSPDAGPDRERAHPRS